MKRAIDSNTICLVASCPEYAFGNYDPVEQIAALAQSWDIGCHSDCCLGSYINPYIEKLGYPLAAKFDFRVPGVTSVSCDPHKIRLWTQRLLHPNVPTQETQRILIIRQHRMERWDLCYHLYCWQ